MHLLKYFDGKSSTKFHENKHSSSISDGSLNLIHSIQHMMVNIQISDKNISQHSRSSYSGIYSKNSNKTENTPNILEALVASFDPVMSSLSTKFDNLSLHTNNKDHFRISSCSGLPFQRSHRSLVYELIQHVVNSDCTKITTKNLCRVV